MATLTIMSDRKGSKDGGFYQYRVISGKMVIRRGRVDNFENCRTVEGLIIEVAKDLARIQEEEDEIRTEPIRERKDPSRSN
jgi:hypothetical protein